MIAAGSDDPFHHYALAMEFRSLDRFDEALTAYANVRTRFPDYVPTYLMAAQVARELERDDEAIEWAKAGVGVAKAAGEDKAVSELQQLLMLLE